VVEPGDAHAQASLLALEQLSYDTAHQECLKALELGCSPSLKSIALNLRGTFNFLRGNGIYYND